VGGWGRGRGWLFEMKARHGTELIEGSEEPNRNARVNGDGYPWVGMRYYVGQPGKPDLNNSTSFLPSDKAIVGARTFLYLFSWCPLSKHL
jgi:hypothetical protein